MAIRQSTVKWFDAKKGYGFIHHPDGGDDVFVHYTQIESEKDFKTLRTGQAVEFEMNDGPKGLHALSVNPTGQEEEELEQADGQTDQATSQPSPTVDASHVASDAALPRVDQHADSSGSSNPADSHPTL
jgi:CspA family cold shock protein